MLLNGITKQYSEKAKDVQLLLPHLSVFESMLTATVDRFCINFICI